MNILGWEYFFVEVYYYSLGSFSWSLIVYKICIMEVYLLKYYFEISHLIYKWRYYRQTVFNQLNIMVSYVDIIGSCHSVAILWEIYVMRVKCHVRWLRFHFNKKHLIGVMVLEKRLPPCPDIFAPCHN